METKTKIFEAFIRLEEFFINHNVSGWANRTKAAIKKIEDNNDFKVVLHDFVGAGMGSIVDLYISEDNGHTLKQSEEATNKQLEQLAEEILKIYYSLKG